MTAEQMAALRDKVQQAVNGMHEVEATSTEDCEPHQFMVHMADDDILVNIDTI